MYVVVKLSIKSCVVSTVDDSASILLTHSIAVFVCDLFGLLIVLQLALGLIARPCCVLPVLVF